MQRRHMRMGQRIAVLETCVRAFSNLSVQAWIHAAAPVPLLNALAQ